jgi:hypothetical protein
MSDINAEMKASAEYAIKAAHERFRQELDYSERSLAKLEHILEEIYWGFSHTTRDEGHNGLIYTTATIWGSYLGEYIRVKWSGKWIVKGSDSVVSIDNKEFSPISLVYQKITSHPEYTVENYINEVKSVLITPVVKPLESRPVTEKIIPPIGQISKKEPINRAPTNQRLIITLLGIGSILFVIFGCIFGFRMIKEGGISVFGLFASATRTNASIPVVESQAVATTTSTNTPSPTVTLLPTYTPQPTITPRPTNTPTQTYTQILTSTPTETQTPFIPTFTRTPRRSPTSVVPTAPPVVATQVPPITSTAPPPPPNTQPPPVVIQSCEINPSTVPAGINVTITFIVHFSSPGYGFDALVNPDFPGQSGCTGIDNDGDSTAFCDGSSGLLPNLTTINVTLRSSVGDCTVSYSSQ